MGHTIFKRQLEKADAIKILLDKYRGTDEWEKARKAFHTIIRTYVHGGSENMTDEELDRHFETALTVTKADMAAFEEHSSSALNAQRDPSSPYYLVNVAHTRHDVYFATNQSCPITGTGNKTLEARFEAKNLYQKYPISATGTMPDRVVNGGPFTSWNSIVAAMTDRATFETTFALTDPQQASETFAVTSAIDWNAASGWLFVTPDLFDGAVFSPALFSVYFFRADAGSPLTLFMIVSANGGGDPEKPFIGVVSNMADPEKNVYASINRFAFSYLSDAVNPIKYWMEISDDNLLDFNLGIQTFYPGKSSPYIEVGSSFSAQAPLQDIAYFKDIPGISTIMLIQKGTLMKDLIKAYFPESTDVQLWLDIGAITEGPEWKMALEALGLDTMSAIFGANVWEEKPTVVS